MSVLSIPRLYAILDAEQLGSCHLTDVAKSLLAAGVRLMQYRNKRATTRELYEAGIKLITLVRPAEGMLIMNDRADVARAVEAAGVHLGQEDLPVEAARLLLPGGIVGVSTHSVAQVEQAGRLPVDYIAFGPVFETHSKQNHDPVVGLRELQRAREATVKPLVAIGGITVENAPAAIKAGADSVAVISALMNNGNVDMRARKILEVLKD